LVPHFSGQNLRKYYTLTTKMAPPGGEI